MYNLISIRNQAGEISDLKQGVRKCYTGIKFLCKKVNVVDTQGVDAQGLHIYI